MIEDDDGRRYADYLLKLRDDLDVADERPAGWRVSVACLIGAAVAVVILAADGTPILGLGLVAAAFGGVPSVYLMGSYRFKARERRAILRRIEQIELRRARIEGHEVDTPELPREQLDEQAERTRERLS